MLEVFILLWATVFNALADALAVALKKESFFWQWRKWTKRQWVWHCFKWLHFYPPLAYVLFCSSLEWPLRIFLIFFCFWVWRLVYKLQLDDQGF
jgi:hypothetical protein